MLTNYRKYRLNDESELAIYQKDVTRYNNFVNRVYSLLDGLADGEGVVVSDVTDDNNIDIFIKVVCLYIKYRNPPTFEQSYIIFTDDFTKIMRVPGFQLPQRYHNNFYEDK